MTAKNPHFWPFYYFLVVFIFLLKSQESMARTNFVDPNATVSFFFTADPPFGWGASYSGNEER